MYFSYLNMPSKVIENEIVAYIGHKPIIKIAYNRFCSA
jgi:hypothetical protein